MTMTVNIKANEILILSHGTGISYTANDYIALVDFDFYKEMRKYYATLDSETICDSKAPAGFIKELIKLKLIDKVNKESFYLGADFAPTLQKIE